MDQPNQPKGVSSSRREFLRKSASTIVAGGIANRLGNIPAVHAAGSDLIKVGLIGCGDRGTGAAAQAVNASPNVKLVAMGDVFRDRLDKSRTLLIKAHGEKIEVPEERCFIGFDAYEKVLASDITYVILTTPPGFRAQHIKAAVAAGKHMFAEKPVAVDGRGVRLCLAAYEEANAKRLCVAVGTQRRHQTGYLETLKRIHDGAIGEIVAGRCYWNQGGVWEPKPRQPKWSDMEHQLRNWYYYTWLSGDHIIEQHVHNLDVINWAKGAHPIRACGLGGRQVRTGSQYGQIFDHFAIDYEYEDGAHLMSVCRQINGCDNEVSESLAGTRGTCQVNRYSIKGKGEWLFRDKDNDPYLQEHVDLIANIRSGNPVNELKSIAESTLTAIMGRMSAYTGKAVTWDQAFNSQLDLVPAELTWGSYRFQRFLFLAKPNWFDRPTLFGEQSTSTFKIDSTFSSKLFYWCDQERLSMMRFGINTFLFASPFTNESTKYFKDFKTWGFESVEIPLEHEEHINAGFVKSELDKHGLVCGGIGCAVGPGRDLRGTLEEQESCLEYIHHMIDMAVMLECPTLLGPIYSSVGRAEFVPEKERKAQWKLVVRHLKRICRYAEKNRRKIALEPLNRFETDFMNTCEQGLQMIQDVESPVLSLLLDTFHMNIEEKDPARAIRRAGRWLGHFHACGSDRGTPGGDHIDWNSISAALRGIRYKGHVVIESFTPDVKVIAKAASIWRVIEPDKNDIAIKGVQFLKSILS